MPDTVWPSLTSLIQQSVPAALVVDIRNENKCQIDSVKEKTYPWNVREINKMTKADKAEEKRL